MIQYLTFYLQRITARQVLVHPWIKLTPPDVPLAAPARISTVFAAQEPQETQSTFDSFVSSANEKLRIADIKSGDYCCHSNQKVALALGSTLLPLHSQQFKAATCWIFEHPSSFQFLEFV
jgi:hypothetical protein